MPWASARPRMTPGRQPLLRGGVSHCPRRSTSRLAAVPQQRAPGVFKSRASSAPCSWASLRAWIEGQWGTAASLQLPLNDRALLLADGLFETVLIRNGAPQLLEEHLQRWSDSAALLGMDPPPQRDALEPLIEDAIQRSQLSEADGVLRLNWSRGSSPQRGIGLPAPGHHRFWLTPQATTPTFSALSHHHQSA